MWFVSSFGLRRALSWPKVALNCVRSALDEVVLVGGIQLMRDFVIIVEARAERGWDALGLEQKLPSEARRRADVGERRRSTR